MRIVDLLFLTSEPRPSHLLRYLKPLMFRLKKRLQSSLHPSKKN